jgi:hypothetical protein
MSHRLFAERVSDNPTRGGNHWRIKTDGYHRTAHGTERGSVKAFIGGAKSAAGKWPSRKKPSITNNRPFVSSAHRSNRTTNFELNTVVQIHRRGELRMSQKHHDFLDAMEETVHTNGDDSAAPSKRSMDIPQHVYEERSKRPPTIRSHGKRTGDIGRV